MSTMSTARLLRAAGSAQQSAEHAEAAGACSSEPCRCWSHGELRHDLARLSIPGDSLARPSVRPWGTFSCRSTTPRAHATNSCMGPVAAAGLPPAPSRSRAQPVGYRTRWLFYYVKELRLDFSALHCKTHPPKTACPWTPFLLLGLATARAQLAIEAAGASFPNRCVAEPRG